MIQKPEAKAFLQTNLIRLMKKQGWSVRALAAESETDAMSISRCCQYGRMPEADKLLRISKILGVTVEELFKPTAAGKKKVLELSKN